MFNPVRSIIPDPDKRRILLSVITVVAVYGMTIGLLHPLISLNMEARGFPRTWIGLMGAIPFLASIFISPIVPRLMRSVNITLLVAACIFADIVLLVMLAFTENIYIWFVLRFLMGVAGTGIFIASETWINEVSEEHYRGRVLGIYTFTLSITFAIAPLFIIVLGTEGHWPFLVPALIIMASFIPLWRTRDSKPDFAAGQSANAFSFILLAPALVGAAAIVSFQEAGLMTLFPVYAVRNGLTNEHAVILVGITAFGSMALQPILGWMADKFNRYLLFIGCTVVTLLMLLIMPFVMHIKFLNPIVLFFWGGSVAGIYTVALVLMGQKFRGSQLAAGNAAFGLMWGVAGFAAPGISGVSMDYWDPHGFVVVMATVTALFLIASAFQRDTKRYYD